MISELAPNDVRVGGGSNKWLESVFFLHLGYLHTFKEKEKTGVAELW